MNYLNYYSEELHSVSHYHLDYIKDVEIPYYATLSIVERNLSEDYNLRELCGVFTDLVMTCKQLDDRIKKLESRLDAVAEQSKDT